VSCFGGILERAVSTFINCIKGLKKGAFTELSYILEGTSVSWSELDKGTQAEWIRIWNKFLNEWAEDHLKNSNVKKLTPAKRSDKFFKAFIRAESPPPYVEEHFRSKFFEGLDALWELYGYNAEGGGARKSRRMKAAKKHTRRKRGSHK
jgi:hypothetical protein